MFAVLLLLASGRRKVHRRVWAARENFGSRRLKPNRRLRSQRGHDMVAPSHEVAFVHRGSVHDRSAWAASFAPETEAKKGIVMLYTLAIVLIILWLLGFVSSYTMGGFIHVLLVIAIVMVLVRIITGKKPL